jgi:hypothetical protein
MTDVINFTKQAFTWSVVAMTIVWSLGLATLAPVAASAATCATIDAGELVKFGTAPAVYVVDEDMALHTFTNQEQLASWGLSSADVTTVDATCINNYKNPTSMAGRGFSYGLMKPEIGATVYLLALDGAMYSIPSAEVATQLWGANWASLMRGIAPFMASNYRINSATALNLSSLPNEILVSYAGKFWVHRNGTVFPIEGTLNSFLAARAIIGTDAMVSGLTVSQTGVSASSLLSVVRDFDMGTPGTGTPGTTTGALTVSLSAAGSDTAIAPVGARLDVLSLNLRAGSSAVNVNGLTFTKSGFMNADDIADVGVYVGSTRYGNERSTFNSDNEMNFNFPQPIVVPANGTVTVVVKARIADDNGSFVGISVRESADVAASATVGGTFPVTGSRIGIASGVTAGELEVISVDNIDESAKFGDDDVTLADFALDNTSDEESVLIESLTFENDGRGELEALLENARLLIDGDIVAANGSVDGDFVMFDLSAPFEIEEGESVTVEVLGDIGAAEENDTIELFLDAVEAYGKDLGFRVALDNDNLDRGSEGKTITVTGGDVTMNFNRAAQGGTPRKEVRPDTDNVVIATLELTSEAEDLEIYSIGSTGASQFFIDGINAANDLQDIQLRQVGGGTYDVETAFAGGELRLEVTDDIYLTKDVKTVFELIADVADTADAGDEFEVVLLDDAFDYEGVTSESDSLDFVPSQVNSAVIEIEQASLDITNVQLTNITAVEGATGVVVYNGRLKASTASDLRVTSLKLTSAAGGGRTAASFSNDTITNLTLRFMDGSTVVATESKSASSISANAITFNGLNVVLPAGKQYTVELVANFATNFGVDDAGDIFGLHIAALADVVLRTNGSGTTYTLVGGDKEFLANSQNTPSRNVTLADEGAIRVDMQVDDANWNRDVYVLAGGTTPAGRYLGELVFQTQDEAFEVRELVFSASGSADISDIYMIQLVDAAGNVVLEEQFEGETTTFEDINFMVEQDTLKSLFVTVKANSINGQNDPRGTALEGATIALTLDGAVVYGMQSREEVDLIDSDGASTPEFGEYDNEDSTNTGTIVGTRLNSVVNGSSNGTFTPGNSRIIGSYTFTFERGMNRYASTSVNGITTTIDGAYEANLQELVLAISTSSDVLITDVQAYVAGNSSDKTDVTSTVLVGDQYVATIDLTTMDDFSVDSGTVTIVIVAGIDVAAGDGTVTISTDILDLDGDFTFNGYSDALLKYIEVNGATFTYAR